MTVKAKNKKSLWDDCVRPACDDMQSMMQQAAASSGRHKNDGGGAPPPKPQQQHPVSRKSSTARAKDCPVRSAQLGRASWTLLHTMAAWYPEQPTDSDQRQMNAFMRALSQFYPCPWCAHDFRVNLDEQPVRTSSRTELCQWLCAQHNAVNRKLGKREFACDMAALDDRWRQSARAACHGGDGGGGTTDGGDEKKTKQKQEKR